MIASSALTIFSADTSSLLELPYADGGIHAGFPSPAQDYLENSIDLNKELIKHPASTFFGRVCGDSMQDAGVNDGDILVIDKSLTPQNGDMAVCFIDGEFTLKYVKISRGVVWLVPANQAYRPIKVTAANNFIIWGIVLYSIKKQSRKG